MERLAASNIEKNYCIRKLHGEFPPKKGEASAIWLSVAKPS